MTLAFTNAGITAPVARLNGWWLITVEKMLVSLIFIG